MRDLDKPNPPKWSNMPKRRRTVNPIQKRKNWIRRYRRRQYATHKKISKGRSREPMLIGKYFHACIHDKHPWFVEGKFYFHLRKQFIHYHVCYYCRMIVEENARKFLKTWVKNFDGDSVLEKMIKDKIIWLPKDQSLNK